MNSETPTELALRSLHACYCALTGQQPPYSFCQRRWFEWQKHFAMDDLRLAVEHALRLNRKREAQYRIPFRFDSFIGDLERFSDLLGDARAAKRQADYRAKHSYTPAKAEVLRATGRPDAPPVPDKPVQGKEVIEGLLRKGFEDALREAEESTRFKP